MAELGQQTDRNTFDTDAIEVTGEDFLDAGNGFYQDCLIMHDIRSLCARSTYHEADV